MEQTITLKLEQFNQLKKTLDDFEAANKNLLQRLHDKGVMERKVFGMLKKIKEKLLNEKGEVDTLKAIELFTDDNTREKFFSEISELKEVIEYYEKNTVFIQS